MKNTNNSTNDFDYLGANHVYLDAACQSLRPRPVVDALERYYYEHNSCGERVKYPWGERTDALVEATRTKTLKLLKLSPRNYFVAFTLNTTYGINLLLNSLSRPDSCQPGEFVVQKIVTSEIEHNSPFLATMAASERLGVPRIVLKRTPDGALTFNGKLSDVARSLSGDLPADSEMDFRGAVVVVNCAANFDGRRLTNLQDVVKRVHADGGLIIIDAAQAMAHYHDLLAKTEADAICFSAHKMYSASLGVMIVRRDLIPKFHINFIGGGMVDDVFEDKYLLSASGNKDHAHTIFEAGLQAWGEIISFGAAIDWLTSRARADQQRLSDLTAELDAFLRSKSKIKMVNTEANPTMSFYVEGMDSHLLGAALGKEGIMARTGYFCAHYYLDKVCHYPALTRFSLSYATRPEDIARVKSAMANI